MPGWREEPKKASKFTAPRRRDRRDRGVTGGTVLHGATEIGRRKIATSWWGHILCLGPWPTPRLASCTAVSSHLRLASVAPCLRAKVWLCDLRDLCVLKTICRATLGAPRIDALASCIRLRVVNTRAHSPAHRALTRRDVITGLGAAASLSILAPAMQAQDKPSV